MSVSGEARLCGCGDELSGALGALCGNCQAALGQPVVLWQGETKKSYEVSEGCESYIAPPSFRVPPGTRVQVILVSGDE